MKNILAGFIFVFVFLTITNSSGQSNKQYAKAADEAIYNGDYNNAITYLRKILDNDSTILSIGYKYAEVSRLTMDYKTAERWYSIINLKDKGGKEFPECSFWLGIVRKEI